MIILDTNVVSALMQPDPSRPVQTWLDRQPKHSIWVSSISVLELRYGLESLPSSKRRTSLASTLSSLLSSLFEDRIADFDFHAAHDAAVLMVLRERAGRSQSLQDTMIAGTVLARRATLATRNIRHFSDLPGKIIDPWQT